MSSLEKLNLNYPLLSKKTIPLGWYFSITAVFNKQIIVKLIYFLLLYSSLDILILWREKNDLQLKELQEEKPLLKIKGDPENFHRGSKLWENMEDILHQIAS